MAVKSNYVFQLKGTLLTSGTSVAISVDLELGTVVSIADARMVLRNRRATKIERAVGTCAAGTMTLSKRGLTQAATEVEDATLKKEWKEGDIVYVTILAPQVADRQEDNERFGFNEFTGGMSGGEFATLAARDTALGGDGVATKAYSGVYVIATGLFYNYNLSTAQWESVETGTVTPNASTSVAGKSQEATTLQVGTQVGTGSTGARTFISPESTKKVSAGAADENKIPVLGADGKLAAGFIPAIVKTIVAGEDLTAGNLTYIDPDGKAWKTIKSASAAVQLSTITGLDTGNKPVQTLYLSIDKCVVFYQKSADNIVYARVVSFAQRTPTVGTEQAVSSAQANDGTFSTVALTSSLFVVAFNKSADDKIYAVACTVSGDIITAGTEVDMSDGTTLSGSTGTSICKLSSSKFVVGWLQATAEDPRVNAGSVSGTTITASAGSAALEAVTATGVPLMTYVQDDVICTFYDDGTNITHKMVTYSGTVPTTKTATDTITGSLANHTAKVFYLGNGLCLLMYATGSAGIIKCVPVQVLDQSARTVGTYDSAQVQDIFMETATQNYFDISYLGNNIFALVNVIDGLADIRMRLLERTYNGFSILEDKTVATTCTYPAVCALTDSMDKAFMAWKNGSDLYYSVYRDTSNQFLGVVASNVLATATASTIVAGDATMSGLTAGLPYYVGDAGAVATTGTRRIGVATTTTNLYIN